MDKIVDRKHIIGERGAVAFNDYCNKHNPYIIFRQVFVGDYGIDGEVEITAANEHGKIMATGDIIKVQLKSTESNNSYMRNETEKSFTYYASEQDINYWSSHKLEVLLVIYDDKQGKLYCKKVPKINQSAHKKGAKTIPINFDKIQNELKPGENRFILTYSNEFKSRVNYDVNEVLVSNMLKVYQHPKYMYRYESNLNNVKEIFNVVSPRNCPYFIIYAKHIFSFHEITKISYPDFYEEVLFNGSGSLMTFNEILSDTNLRNHYIELINQHIKDFLRKQAMIFTKGYKRYFFSKPVDEDIREVTYKTRKTKQVKTKKVVSYHEYGKDKFYRHWALSIEYFFTDEDLFAIFHPKYFFSLDGTTPLQPKDITKYTNFLTSREFNASVINNIHFFIDYLSKGQDSIKVYEGNKNKILITAQMEKFNVDFGIANDLPKERSTLEQSSTSNSLTLFGDEY